ncbi:predicted protein [Scheffersomyces stipitis CBS 6054]|uniref:protein-histidine N-methyltransferase n=1 Tax=Scheffersomyces stipitis (strain ATCC 58785 / CBS 6054 / NBRC 10063 / NRRL Y-11545) TaxID=322104 RepID=A3LRX1_PICST|nr:predicted protein [Scheffersomyces stipitis CBS 6054]ABN65805.1 predicted protein [Scheffersomyces stipitis CBS 6054]
MSFSFGFTKEDFSDDDFEESSHTHLSDYQKVNGNEKVPNSLSTFSSTIERQNLPVIHSTESLLQTLRNVRLTFDNYTTPIGQNIVYRRELFDVKHQVMTEDNQENTKINEILIDLNDKDLEKRVYEGGFKSWECSYDTVDLLAKFIQSDSLLSTYSSYLDFGCGTSLPSSFLLLQKFQRKNRNPIKVILSDFNQEVLRLVSLPNILIHWASTLEPQLLHDLTTSEDIPYLKNDELLITDALIDTFINDLKEYNVELVFISGSWGTQFNQLIEKYAIDFIISSETIYSLETLPLVAESIVDILEKSGTKEGRALIAAKNIYFGVGGSVIEFLHYLSRVKTDKFTVQAEEVDDAQLKRSMIDIVYKA